MEQLSIELVAKLMNSDTVELKSTQETLCFPIIVRIYRKMKMGIKFSGIKVEGDQIIDGHHRFVASLMAGVALDRFPSSSSSATVVIGWNKVKFDEKDWDTLAKINMLNALDARFNGLTQEQMEELVG